ncbi:Rrf2 family transcriptional regulator [Thermomicrobium sp. 4228-Ro]|uniref:RrF2 family transcriptional regulator n=1 Tax=Thermomicrobium sp. 4228-Ro TaxID=2993937 RepID=UPI002248FA6D|nr:Rrf2 family transcriptional regulator [Thermomicrobium sp. 4228-Ro]MCX2728465.1 Rrf2 family transcriptional regulator [Thermomicrobium sp. 4228-Ro]
MLSRTSRYALLATIVLAQHPNEWMTARDLALATAIPANYLTKILHTMARARVLRSQRGREGGFRLARPPERVRLAEIVSLFEEPHFLSYCLLGTETCPADRPCIAHDRWLAVVEAVARFLDETTLADIARATDGGPVGPLGVLVSGSGALERTVGGEQGVRDESFS